MAAQVTRRPEHGEQTMARKIVNRKALREEVEAAEKADAGQEEGGGRRKPPNARVGAKEPADLRKKVYWGVFNQSLKRVATFEFNQKKEAEKKAEALSQSGKTPHFVQKVKETLDA